MRVSNPRSRVQSPEPQAGTGDLGPGTTPVPLGALNPDIRYVGPGPEGCRCGECGNLGGLRIATVPRPESGARGSESPVPRSTEQTLYYCTLTGQAKRATWPACANFVAVEDLPPRVRRTTNGREPAGDVSGDPDTRPQRGRRS